MTPTVEASLGQLPFGRTEQPGSVVHRVYLEPQDSSKIDNNLFYFHGPDARASVRIYENGGVEARKVKITENAL